MTTATPDYATRLRTLQTMRGILSLPASDDLKRLLLNAQREEIQSDSPDQNLLQFLSLLGSDDESARAKANEFLGRLEAALPPPADLMSARPDVQAEVAKLVEPAPLLDTPAASPGISSVLRRTVTLEDTPATRAALDQLLSNSLASIVPESIEVAPIGPKVYRAEGEYLGPEYSLSFLDDAGAGLPEEHFTAILAGKATDPAQTIIGAKGLIFSVEGCTQLNPGLSFVTPMAHTVLFSESKSGNIGLKMALRLPMSIVHFDDHVAPHERHAGAFIELYHLMNLGYIFLVEVNIVPMGNGTFTLQLNRDTIRYDRQNKAGENIVMDAVHLTALRFAIDKLAFAGFLGVVQ